MFFQARSFSHAVCRATTMQHVSGLPVQTSHRRLLLISDFISSPPLSNVSSCCGKWEDSGKLLSLLNLVFKSNWESSTLVLQPHFFHSPILFPTSTECVLLLKECMVNAMGSRTPDSPGEIRICLLASP